MGRGRWQTTRECSIGPLMRSTRYDERGDRALAGLRGDIELCLDERSTLHHVQQPPAATVLAFGPHLIAVEAVAVVAERGNQPVIQQMHFDRAIARFPRLAHAV